MKNLITQLWLFWHGQHGQIWKGTFRYYYKCSVCESKRWLIPKKRRIGNDF